MLARPAGCSGVADGSCSSLPGIRRCPIDIDQTVIERVFGDWHLASMDQRDIPSEHGACRPWSLGSALQADWPTATRSAVWAWRIGRVRASVRAWRQRPGGGASLNQLSRR
jgi:hypothetical protein